MSSFGEWKLGDAIRNWAVALFPFTFHLCNMLERRQQLLRRLHASSKTKTDDFQRNSLLLKCDLKYKMLSAFFFHSQN